MRSNILRDILDGGIISGATALLLAFSSAQFACINAGVDCTIDQRVRWVTAHPVFSSWVPASIPFGMVMGPILSIVPIRWTPAIAWTVIVLMIVAFVVWGLPEVQALGQKNAP
ncbi:MAG: hypothetical protein K2Q06_05035 [Parvularculaceae bacterium]|nr:hypothetical protein [Parvularculaceae bacterium]